MSLSARLHSKPLRSETLGEGLQQQVPGVADVWPRLGTTSLAASPVLAHGDGSCLGSFRKLSWFLAHHFQIALQLAKSLIILYAI